MTRPVAAGFRDPGRTAQRFRPGAKKCLLNLTNKQKFPRCNGG